MVAIISMPSARDVRDVLPSAAAANASVEGSPQILLESLNNVLDLYDDDFGPRTNADFIKD